MRQRPVAGMALRLLAVAALSVMFACVKQLDMRGVAVVESLFWRQAILIVTVLIWVILRHGPRAGLASLRTDRPRAHGLRMAVGLVAMGFNFWSFTLLPLAEATTIGFAVPLFATMLAALWLKEPTGRHRWGAIIVGLVGVLIVLQPGGAAIPISGATVALVAALLTATVTIVIRRLGATEPAPTIAFWFGLTSLVPLSLALPLVIGPHDCETWLYIAAMGIAGGIAQLALTAALRLAPVALVMPMDYTALLWASIIGWLTLGALPGSATLWGAPVIVASGLYILWRETVRRRAALGTQV